MRLAKNAQDYNVGDFIKLNGPLLDAFAQIISRETYIAEVKERPIDNLVDNIYFRTFNGKILYRTLNPGTIKGFGVPSILSLEDVEEGLKNIKKDCDTGLEVLSLIASLEED